MLPKEVRLTSRDVESLKEGKSVFGTLISFRFRTAKKTKFSVSVSKKIASTAVERNRIRRRTYSLLENYVGRVNAPVYGLFMPKKDFMRAPTDILKREVESVLSKACLL